MYFNKKFWSLSATALLLASNAGTVIHQVSAQESETPQFEASITNEGTPIEGGELKVAIVGDNFPGILNDMYWSVTTDGAIVDYFNPSLFGYDDNFKIDDSGFAEIGFDPENKQVTITIPEGVEWEDGEPLTIDDVIFPYYVVGHPDYTGIRYGIAFSNVEGMEDYKNGDTDTIQGLERVDDHTLIITYNEFTNSIMHVGGGLSSYIEPEHILGDTPVAELEDHEAIRQSPVGFGAFKVTNIVPGESVSFEANENYYQGRPKIDRVTIQVVNPTSVVAELKAGNYDIATIPVEHYDTVRDAANFTVIGTETNNYSFIGFKMGTWDEEAGEVNYEPERVVSNKALRQAMAYAIDNDAIGEEVYQGLKYRANSHITPNFVEVYNAEQEGYPYDPDKARDLLAEAGFEDTDGDGFVEDLNGEPFTLGFATPGSGEVDETIALYYLQAWAEVGIDVALVDDQIMEFNSFYERVENDDPDIDVFNSGWTIGGDPNQYKFYGRDVAWNEVRFASEELDALHERLNSGESFDEEFRLQAYNDWQAYMIEEIPTLPTFFSYYLTAVNNRVSEYDVSLGADLDWTSIELLEEEPVRE